MEAKKINRIIIGGGGTGGHVFPAISIANALRKKDPSLHILFVGALGRLEMEKVPEAGYRIIGLPVSGLQRRLTWKNIVFLWNLLRSTVISRKIIKTFKPDVAVGVGGYASGPILRAAARKKVPVVLQEQNSYAGLTNRLLSKFASTICVAYDGMDRYFPADKIILTGNPVRQQLFGDEQNRNRHFEHFQLKGDKPLVLVIGGSLGARTLNTAMLGGLEKLERSGMQVLWQTGKYYYQEADEVLKTGTYKNIKALPFISRMEHAYGSADLIVSRAGAGTISELCLVGKPVILVPSPNVAEDHQTKNAMALTDKDAAVMIRDNEAGEKLVDAIIQLMDDPEKRKILAEGIKALAIGDSADRIAGEIFKLILK